MTKEQRTFEIVVVDDHGRVSEFGRVLVAALIEDDEGRPLAVEDHPDDWPPR